MNRHSTRNFFFMNPSDHSRLLHIVTSDLPYDQQEEFLAIGLDLFLAGGIGAYADSVGKTDSHERDLISSLAAGELMKSSGILLPVFKGVHYGSRYHMKHMGY